MYPHAYPPHTKHTHTHTHTHMHAHIHGVLWNMKQVGSEAKSSVHRRRNGKRQNQHAPCWGWWRRWWGGLAKQLCCVWTMHSPECQPGSAGWRSCCWSWWWALAPLCQAWTATPVGHNLSVTSRHTLTTDTPAQLSSTSMQDLMTHHDGSSCTAHNQQTGRQAVAYKLATDWHRERLTDHPNIHLTCMCCCMCCWQHWQWRDPPDTVWVIQTGRQGS